MKKVVIMGGILLLMCSCPKKKAVSPEITTKEEPPTAPEVTVKPGKPEIIEEIQKQLQRIHFDFDKATIRNDAAEILKRNAEILKKYPNIRIVIEGHCDERGTNEYNLALGQRRAEAAKKYLVNLGISPERIETVSYGEERPLDPGHDESAWAKNRRAEFVVIEK
jgi:peptidoglycan-associated lipoprotein